MSAPQLTVSERSPFCRCCDVPVPKGAPVVYLYSWRNRGQSIYFCLPCAQALGQLAQPETQR